jgi:hypothetical protein
VLLDAYQRLQMARNNEQPPGSLRLARRQQQLANNTKPVAKTKRKNSCCLSIDNDRFFYSRIISSFDFSISS